MIYDYAVSSGFMGVLRLEASMPHGAFVEV